jgi:hypothetical protein
MPPRPRVLRLLLVLAALLALSAQANILDEKVVDFVVIEKDDPTVYLDIVQQLPWNEDTYQRLDRKVDAYVRYVTSGNLLKQNPQAAGLAVAIRVVYVEAPGPGAVWRLEAVKTRIKPRGVGLTWVPLTPPPRA